MACICTLRIVQRHVSLDVRPEQYAVVGHTLLASMEVSLYYPQHKFD